MPRCTESMPQRSAAPLAPDELPHAGRHGPLHSPAGDTLSTTQSILPLTPQAIVDPRAGCRDGEIHGAPKN